MTASISAPNWKIRTAAKVMHTKHIRVVLRRAAQISQRALKKSLNVAFPAYTGAEGQQSQCLRDLGGAA